MIAERLRLAELFGDVAPDEVPNVTPVTVAIAARSSRDPGCDLVGQLALEFREPGQKAERDHVVRLAAAHGLAQLEDGLLALSGEPLERAAQELRHPAGDVVARVERLRGRQVRLADRGEVLDLLGPLMSPSSVLILFFQQLDPLPKSINL